MLVPVVKDINRRELEGIQANITPFFEKSVGIETNKSFADGVFTPRRRVKKSEKK